MQVSVSGTGCGPPRPAPAAEGPVPLWQENHDDSFFASQNDERFFGKDANFGKHKDFNANLENFRAIPHLGQAMATSAEDLLPDDSSGFVRGGRSRMSMATVVRQMKNQEDNQNPLRDREALDKDIDRCPVSATRKRLMKMMLTNQWVDRVIMALILANCISSAAIDPTDVDNTSRRNQILSHLEYAFTGAFAAEAILRSTIQGLTRFRFSYLRDRWNIFDLVIVVISSATLLVEVFSDSDAAGITTLRTFRILRPLKAVTRLRGLQLIITVLLRSLRGLVDVLLLCLFFIVLTGIVGVQLFNNTLTSRCVPDDLLASMTDGVAGFPEETLQHFREDTRICGGSLGHQCPWGVTCTVVGNPNYGYTSFDHMGWASLTIFTIVTLEGWSTLMYHTMDGTSDLAALYYVVVVLSGAFFIANLVLVTINTVFFSAREQAGAADDEEDGCHGENDTFLSTCSSHRMVIDALAHHNPTVSSHDAGDESAAQPPASPPAAEVEVPLPPAACPVAPTADQAKAAPAGTATTPERPPPLASCSSTELLSLLPGLLEARPEAVSLRPEPQRPTLASPVTLGSSVGSRSILSQSQGSRHGGEARKRSARSRVSIQSPLEGSQCSRGPTGEKDRVEEDGSREGTPLRRPVSEMWECLPQQHAAAPSVGSPLVMGRPSLVRKADHSHFSEGGRGETGSLTQGVASVAGTPQLSSINPESSGIQLLSPLSPMTPEELKRFRNTGFAVTPTTIGVSNGEDSGAIGGGGGCECECEGEGEGGAEEAWLRGALRRLVQHPVFVNAITATILANTAVLAAEHHDQPDSFTAVADVSNIVFTVIFIVETCLMVYVYRGQFADDRINIFDGLVSAASAVDVALSIVTQDTGDTSGISVFRAFRLLRLLKLAKQFPDLLRTFTALVESLEGVSVLTLLLFLVIFVYAQLGMHLFGGRFCGLDTAAQYDPATDFCPQLPRGNYDNLGWALVTVFQVITGEDWGTCMYNGMRATNQFAALYFVTLLVVGNYIVLSLFVAVLINNTQFAPAQEQLLMDSSKAGPAALQATLPPNPLATSPSLAPEAPPEPARPKCSLHMGLEEDTPASLALKKYIAFLEVARLEEVAKAFHNAFSPGGSPKGIRSIVKKFNKTTDAEPERKLNAATAEYLAACPETAKVMCDLSWDAEKQEFHGTSILQLLKGMNDLSQEVCRDRYRALFFLSSGNCARRLLVRVVEHVAFEVVVVLLIVLSTVSLAMQNPIAAPDTAFPRTLGTIDLCLVSCFAFEVVLKIGAYGFVLHPTAYLRRDPWNAMDFVIALLSGVSLLVSGAEAVGIFRMIRTLRPLRFITKSTGMKLVLESLLSSLYPLLHIGLVTGMIFAIFAILGVHLFKGSFYACTDVEWGDVSYRTEDPITTREACLPPYRWKNTPSHFDNLGAALVTLFEMSTLEGWASVMHNGMDAMSAEVAPQKNNKPYFALYFLIWIVVGSFFIVNLFIGVLIDHYDYARAKNEKEMILGLTPEQQLWISMQDVVFHAVEVRASRRATLTNCCSRSLQVVVASPLFEKIFATAIVLNSVTAATQHSTQSQGHRDFLELANYIFVGLFTVEVCMRLGAAGLKVYFQENWNRFDAFIVAVSLLGVTLSSILDAYSPVISVFRLMRLFRLARIVKSTQEVRNLLRTLWLSLPSLANIAGLLSLIYFLYAVIGVHLFGRITEGRCLGPRANFHSFGNAMLLMFRLSTGEDWQCVMDDCRVSEPDCSSHLDGCGNSALAPLFYITFILIVMYVMLNILIAVILGGYDSVQEELDQPVTSQHMEEFFEEYDYLQNLHSATDDSDERHLVDPTDPQYWSLETVRLPLLLRRLPPPLGLERSIAYDARNRNLKKMGLLGILVHELSGKVALMSLIAGLSHTVRLPESLVEARGVVDEDFIGEALQQESRRQTEKWKAACRTQEKQWGRILTATQPYVPLCSSPRMQDICTSQSVPRQVIYTLAALRIQQVWRGWLGRRLASQQQVQPAPSSLPRRSRASVTSPLRMLFNPLQIFSSSKSQLTE